MIPRNIEREYILQAMEKIDIEGVPSSRRSTKYSLEYQGKHYPPKYVLSLANEYVNEVTLKPQDFTGGDETNRFLKEMGFTVVTGSINQPMFPLEVHSWTALTPQILCKRMDRSCFLHGGTGIPFEIKPFLHIESLKQGERASVELFHRGEPYNGHILLDKEKTPRARLFWSSAFSELIKNSFPEWHNYFSDNKDSATGSPIIRLYIEKPFQYVIEFIETTTIVNDIEAEITEEMPPASEGGTKYYFGKRYERNPLNRQKAIAYHGTKCNACGFDFEAVYGERGKGFIEVHHTKPLSTVDEVHEVDPVHDLITVCSNCHRMIHRNRDKVLSVEEVKKLIGILAGN